MGRIFAALMLLAIGLIAGHAPGLAQEPFPAEPEPPAESRFWFAFSVAKVGGGFGSSGDTGYGRDSLDWLKYVDILGTRVGFEDLGGLGLGTSLFELLQAKADNPAGEGEWNSDGHVNGALPVYLYFPISHETFVKKGETRRAPDAFVYAGGCAWANPDYVRAGLSGKLIDIGVARFGFDIGGFYVDEAVFEADRVAEASAGFHVLVYFGEAFGW